MTVYAENRNAPGTHTISRTTVVSQGTTPPNITALSLNPSAAWTNAVVGQTRNTTAVTTPANQGSQISWTSTNRAVATVDVNGRITARGAGTATITAIAPNGRTATKTVTIPGVQRPGTPGTSISNVTSSGFTLNWTAPTSGGAVTQYIVQLYRASGINPGDPIGQPRTFASTARSTTFTNLAPGSYLVRLHAVNSGGSTMGSDWIVEVRAIQFPPNTPPLFTSLVRNQADVNRIRHTNDGFFIYLRSLACILNDAGIFNIDMRLISNTTGANITRSTPVQNWYAEWYIFALTNGNNFVYGLFCMRGQGNRPQRDAQGFQLAASNNPAFRISFVEFNTQILLNLINNNTQANQFAFNTEVDRVIRYVPANHNFNLHNVRMQQYFSNPHSNAGYLLAEAFTDKIAATIVNNRMNITHPFAEVLDRIEYLERFICQDCRRNPLNYCRGYACRTVRFSLPNYRRIPDFLNSGGVFNANTRRLYFRDSRNLTHSERLAILAIHTGNVTFNAFTAEIVMHSYTTEFSGIITLIPEYRRRIYASALRSDHGVWDNSDTEWFLRLHPRLNFENLNSPIVQEQVRIHGWR